MYMHQIYAVPFFVKLIFLLDMVTHLQLCDLALTALVWRAMRMGTTCLLSNTGLSETTRRAIKNAFDYCQRKIRFQINRLEANVLLQKAFFITKALQNPIFYINPEILCM